MRISMVVAQDAPGDSDRAAQVMELSAALAREGHQVVVHTRRNEPDTPDWERTEDGVVVAHVAAGPPRPLPLTELLPHLNDFCQALAAEWCQHRPDVAHAHFWPAGIASLMAARGLEVPVVQSFHALGAAEYQHLERLVGQRAGQIAAASTEELSELLRIGVRRPRVSVVPYGVDLRRFAPNGPIMPRGDAHRVVCIGRSLERRDHDVAIAALSRVPKTELVIAGGPEPAALATDPEARRLREVAEHCGVADRVQLIGHVAPADMPALLRSADLALCLPHHSPAGIAPLEAMACGVPVVAASTGAVTDEVVDGVTGRHVPPQDPFAVAETVRHLLADPTVLEAYGAAGRDRVRARYSWRRIAVDTIEVYHRAGARPPTDVTASAAW